MMATSVSTVLLGAAFVASMSPSDTGDPAFLDAQLAHMEVSLTTREPYHFVLAYRGRTIPFRGQICYHFAGYNETCTSPKLEWLTPATRIELYAPGGVPRDLLEGYMMLVRYPALSDRTFRYAPPNDA